jgi:hypothetical protein
VFDGETNDIESSTLFYIGFQDQEFRNNKGFIDSWHADGAGYPGNLGVVYIRQEEDYSHGIYFRITGWPGPAQPNMLGTRFNIDNVKKVGDGLIHGKKYRFFWSYTGSIGNTGAQGERGEPGGGGARGGTGLTPFYYENLSLVELKSDQDCCPDNNYIYYQGFIAGFTTTLQQIKIRVQDGAAVLGNTGGTQPVTIAIYNSVMNLVVDGEQQEEQYVPSSRNGDARQVTANGSNNQILTIDYTSYSNPNPPVLEAGKFYFIALKQDDNGDSPAPYALTFWGDRDFDGTSSLKSGSASYKTQKIYTPTGLPTTTPNIVPDPFAGFWFSLFGSPFGTILGPTLP